MIGAKIDFFASRAAQRRSLAGLSARELAAFETELRRSPPFSKDSPLLQLVIREGARHQRSPRRRPTLRHLVKTIIRRSRGKLKKRCG